jgi:hypothetical protein
MIGTSVGEGTFGKVKLGKHILTGEKVSRKFEFNLNRLLLRYWRKTGYQTWRM